MAGEMYCNIYHHHYDLNIVNCRFLKIWTKWIKYINVIPNFVNLSMFVESLPLTGTGDETRDFTFDKNLVR